MSGTSILGEDRIPLSFKVVCEPELGATRPAGTSGEDFKANRMVLPRVRECQSNDPRSSPPCAVWAAPVLSCADRLARATKR